MPELTDLSYVRALCEKYDFALSKGFGQNFIVNPGLPPKIVDASGVDKRYGVLEIGPGIGVLTRELAKRAAKVVSIEVDERLPPLLAETMAGVDNFKLVLQDVLKVDLKALIAQEFPGMPAAHREPDRDGAEGSCRSAGGCPGHPGLQRHQLCGELLRDL